MQIEGPRWNWLRERTTRREKMAEQAFSFPRAVFFAVDSMSSRRASEAAPWESENGESHAICDYYGQQQTTRKSDGLIVSCWIELMMWFQVWLFITIHIALQNLCLLKLIQAFLSFSCLSWSCSRWEKAERSITISVGQLSVKILLVSSTRCYQDYPLEESLFANVAKRCCFVGVSSTYRIRGRERYVARRGTIARTRWLWDNYFPGGVHGSQLETRNNAAKRQTKNNFDSTLTAATWIWDRAIMDHG